MDAWIEQLASLNENQARELWVGQHPELQCTEALVTLHTALLHLVYSDIEAADRLSCGARVLADTNGDELSRAVALRCAGHVHFIRAEHAQALGAYTMAVALFEAVGHETDIARTLNGALQSLIYLGDFDRALEWAARAGEIFERDGDHLRLARLNSNIGNILYRQDRHAKAMEYSQKALEALRPIGEPRDIAAALSNVAVCSTSLGQFPEALAAYDAARKHCEFHGLTVLVAAADYNIAYLYYLRGDYLRAMELYAETRRRCEVAGDSYHAALCDLDESEMYLELNLTTEGRELARRAATKFDELQMEYERAKALVNQGVAETYAGSAKAAVRLFRSARQLFVEQQNEIWPALIDLYQAILAQRRGETSRAERLCRLAYQVLRNSRLPGKATLCELLDAQLALQRGHRDDARRICLSAMQRLDAADAPSQRYQAHFVMGQIEEASGSAGLALVSYRAAQQEIESLRTRLWGENSRISFLKNKLAVYEGLVALYVERGEMDQAFACIEQAKSRSMMESLSFPGLTTPGPEIEEMRQDLNWIYRQIEIAALSTRSGAANQIEVLQKSAREREEELARRFHAMVPATTLTRAETASPVPIEDIRSRIPADGLLAEYYEARGILYVCLLDQNHLETLPVASIADVQARMRLFEFQMAKFTLGQKYLSSFAGKLLAATISHLRGLYDCLIAPFEKMLDGRKHVIFVPHGVLHNLPFHALHDGSGFLIDRLPVSYAPSAGIYALCSARPATAEQRSLVLGVPTAQAPQIEHEARAVAAVLPESRLFEGDNATSGVLRLHGPGSRYLHIATHGMFRRDNPLFSSIRLGDSHLSLLDLYQIPLSAEMVTLSGCSTGLHAIIGADELVGLVRGLLYAGARSALVSLWDVNDNSTTEFMTSLYPALLTQDKASAVRAAMLHVRSEYPHPYYWAPFVLVGDRN